MARIPALSSAFSMRQLRKANFSNPDIRMVKGDSKPEVKSLSLHFVPCLF